TGGKLYGRGSADMKSALAASILAVEALRATGTTPTANVELSFTADEETGGQLGAGWLVKNKIVRPDWAVVCEGGSRDKVGVGHKGVLWLEFHLQGVAAHGSAPEKG